MARYTETTEALETHLSLFAVARDNWTWLFGLLGLTGLSSWLVWLREEALAAPWYDKALFVTFAVVFAVFIVSGIRAFVAVQRTAKERDRAIGLHISWSGNTYTNGRVIDGGTHRLVAIFGTDQMRSNLLFKNCQIVGPGAVSYFNCTIEKSEFFGLPAVQEIMFNNDHNFSMVTWQFVKCRFENCVFSNVLHIGNIMNPALDIHIYRVSKISSPVDGTLNPQAALNPVPTTPEQQPKM